MNCGITISYLPSFLVPYKHFTASVIEDCFLLVLYYGLSVHQAWHRRLNACEGTIRHWLIQFKGNFNVLKQELFSRTGISSVGIDGIDDLFITLWLHYFTEYKGERSLFESLQADLFGTFPGIGIFRVLFPASDINSRGSP